MAFDKLVDSTQLNADLTTVANAIRAKSGTTEQLSFPSGMVQAIEDLRVGGGANWFEFTPASYTTEIIFNGVYHADNFVICYCTTEITGENNYSRLATGVKWNYGNKPTSCAPKLKYGGLISSVDAAGGASTWSLTGNGTRMSVTDVGGGQLKLSTNAAVFASGKTYRLLYIGI